jgi:mevalonate kinase
MLPLSPLTRSYTLPGKALLFGEYGLLLGLPGVVVTLPAFPMEVVCSLIPAKGTPEVRIKSALLPKQHLTLRGGERGFFPSLLAPYQEVLTHFRRKGYDLTMAVTRYFPPSLGMGSSSALLASFHAFLFSFLDAAPPLSSPIFFERLHTSINDCQGAGSGYDATLQLAAQGSSVPQLWRYQRAPHAALPDFSVLPPSSKKAVHYGTILKTNRYARTKKALKRFATSGDPSLAQAHGALATRFLQDPSPSHLLGLMEEAQHLQKQQGILPNLPLLQRLRAAQVPFKSLGAGFGDCLWSPWKAEGLSEFQEAIVTEVILPCA